VEIMPQPLAMPRSAGGNHRALIMPKALMMKGCVTAMPVVVMTSAV